MFIPTGFFATCFILWVVFSWICRDKKYDGHPDTWPDEWKKNDDDFVDPWPESWR